MFNVNNCAFSSLGVMQLSQPANMQHDADYKQGQH